MGWTVKLDREREWPVGTKVTELKFRDPTLRLMRGLPGIEEVRTFPDKSSTYTIKWDAVETWLTALIEKPEDVALVQQLTAAESERAKETLLGFFLGAAGASNRSEPPMTSASAPPSALIRID